MKKLVMKDVLGKSLKELIKLRNKLRKELYEYKIKNSLRALTQTHLIPLTRKNIARINGAITKKAQEFATKS